MLDPMLKLASNFSGGNGNDLLIAGRTPADADLGGADLYMSSWLKAKARQKLATLNARTGLFSQASMADNQGDILIGGAGTDSFLGASEDQLRDLLAKKEESKLV